MKDDEIKEILDFKENADYKRLSCDEIAILKDYITNLQQENEHLRTDLNTLKNTIIEVNKESNSLFNHLTKKDLNYKSRCEKADEYIKEHTTSFGDVFIPASESWYLSDILNGRSDE